MFSTAFLLHLIFVIVKASKCPESKRPHNTNCTMFYNCINLPIDGFVWVPSKCSDGLVYQQYLQTCVLPGDTWACNNSEDESFVTITDYENYTQSNAKALVSTHLYNLNDTSDTLNGSAMALHPSIKVKKTIVSKQDNKYNNIISPITINHKEENYLYEYINGESETAFPTTNEDKDQVKSRYAWINQLINRLRIYKELLKSLDQLMLPSVDSLKHIDPAESTKISEEITNRADNIDNGNNLIIINDNFGNKQYLTVEKYKSLDFKIDPSFLNVIPCIKDIRFANKTDCTKYYTCEPSKAYVKEFTCPDNTAFNEYTRVCDAYKYKICKQHKSIYNELSLIKQTGNNNSTTNDEIPKEKICQEIGRMEDPTSNIYYYICYSSSKTPGNIKAVRMRCPNNLKFCKSKKVCTTNQLCTV